MTPLCWKTPQLAIKTPRLPVPEWFADRTTLLGISFCFWIWLRGIDRFLSRQMWLLVAPASEGRAADWIAHGRPPSERLCCSWRRVWLMWENEGFQLRCMLCYSILFLFVSFMCFLLMCRNLFNLRGIFPSFGAICNAMIKQQNK